jgi:phospholipase D1/2
MPDSEVKNWKEYKEYAAYGERFAEMQSQPSKASNPPAQRQTGPPGGNCSASAPLGSPVSMVSPKTEVPSVETKTSRTIDEKLGLAGDGTGNQGDRSQSEHARQETLSSIDEKSCLKTASDPHLLSTALNGNDGNPVAGEDVEKPRSNSAHVDYSEAVNLNASQSRRRRRRATTIGSKQFHATDDVMDKQCAEEFLNKTQGHLILWPYDW